MLTINFAAFYDLHAHLRDGEMMQAVVQHHQRSCEYVLVMPNLKPPIETADQLHEYRRRIMIAQTMHALPSLNPLMVIKLTKRLTPQMVREAKAAGAVGVKFYAEGTTTNADDGVADIFDKADVLAVMEALDLVLCLHGEIPGVDPDVAEQAFKKTLIELSRRFPWLRIVFEHVSSAALVSTIKSLPGNVVATVTAHHLFLTKDDVFEGGVLAHPHHFCKPLAKQKKDRAALIKVVLEGNPKFFFGSDSAPHLKTAKESTTHACPAGVYTAPILAPLLVEFFIRHGALHLLPNFTSGFGGRFYRLPLPTRLLTLVAEDWQVPDVYDGIVPFMSGKILHFKHV